MICSIVHKIHNFLLSQMLEWCSAYQTLNLVMWLFLVVVLYMAFVALFKMLSVYNFKRQSDALTSICKAIEENDFVSCVRLLNEYPQCINKFTNEGYTPFLIACANGNTQLVKLMLRKEVKNVKYEIRSRLTTAGANITLKSARNESPFYLAAFYYIKNPQLKNATCIRELYYSGANINEPNEKGLTPLQMAAMFGHTPLVKWLLVKNASTNTIPNPYLIACTQGHQDTAMLIWRFTGFSLKFK